MSDTKLFVYSFIKKYYNADDSYLFLTMLSDLEEIGETIDAELVKLISDGWESSYKIADRVQFLLDQKNEKTP